MNSTSMIVFALQQIAFNVPLYLVLMIAIWLSIANWNKARQPAMLTMLGSVMIIGESIMAGILRAFLMQNSGMAQIANWFMVISAMSSLSFAAGVMLIVAAVFMDRKRIV